VKFHTDSGERSQKDLGKSFFNVKLSEENLSGRFNFSIHMLALME
jgi:hypothetical protein